MRVLHVGDIARVAIHLCRFLRAEGIEANVLVARKEGEPAFPSEPWIRCLPRRDFVRSSLGLLRHAIALGRQCDILHGHALGNIVTMVTGRPYIAQFHGSDVREVAVSSRGWGPLLRLAARRADRVLVSTPDLIDYLQTVGLSREKIEFLPNPVDTTVFAPVPPSLDLHDGHAAVILHPTRPQSIKRTEWLFQAYARLWRDYDVILYAVDHGTDSPQSREIRQLVRQLGLTSVRFLPRIPLSEMPRYLNAADIVADQFSGLPAFSLVGLEAMACAKPLVASLPDTPGFYGRNAPVVRSNSVDDVERALRFLLENPHEWHRIGEACRAWVETHHAPSVVVNRLIRIYGEVVEVT